MPSVLLIGPYRLFFCSSDGNEPLHIQIERDDAVAKYWLEPVRLARSQGFRGAELRDIERIVVEHQNALIEAWHDYFGH